MLQIGVVLHDCGFGGKAALVGVHVTGIYVAEGGASTGSFAVRVEGSLDGVKWSLLAPVSDNSWVDKNKFWVRNELCCL